MCSCGKGKRRELLLRRERGRGKARRTVLIQREYGTRTSIQSLLAQIEILIEIVPSTDLGSVDLLPILGPDWIAPEKKSSPRRKPQGRGAASPRPLGKGNPSPRCRPPFDLTFSLRAPGRETAKTSSDRCYCTIHHHKRDAQWESICPILQNTRRQPYQKQPRLCSFEYERKSAHARRESEPLLPPRPLQAVGGEEEPSARVGADKLPTRLPALPAQAGPKRASSVPGK